MKTTRLQHGARSHHGNALRSDLSPLLTHLFLLASLAGCGDDSVGSTNYEPTTTETTDIPSTASTSTTTDDVPTTGEAPTTGATVPDDTSTTDEMPPPGDESTTGAPTGCHGLVDGDDDDADGVKDTHDNCPCEANPNQLDFDGNAIGNVCDLALSFTIVDGAPPELNKFTTTAHAKKTLECEFGVDLVARDGTVEVELDDAGMAKLHLANLKYSDTPELSCDLGLGLVIKLKVQQFFAEGVDSFTVGFPFTIPDHQAGTLIGMTDSPHKILASAIINVTESPNDLLLPEGEEPLVDISGVFPTALVSVSNEDQQVSLVFADQELTLFEQTTEAGINFRLTGLTGTLRLKR